MRPYLRVADDGLARVLGKELHPLLPLVDIVGVLPKQNGAHLAKVGRETGGWERERRRSRERRVGGGHKSQVQNTLVKAHQNNKPGKHTFVKHS